VIKACEQQFECDNPGQLSNRCKLAKILAKIGSIALEKLGLFGDYIVEHLICLECHGYKPMGPSTDYESLDRQEKQIGYEQMRAATDESKLSRRRRRNHMKSKWVLRHSQIKAAAKKRGVPKKAAKVKGLSARRNRQAIRLEAEAAAAGESFYGIDRGVAPSGTPRWNGEQS